MHQSVVTQIDNGDFCDSEGNLIPKKGASELYVVSGQNGASKLLSCRIRGQSG